MCGRYSHYHTWAEIHHLYSLTIEADKFRNVPARYNIAPTQDVLFIASQDGQNHLREGRWWLVPFWAKELPKYPMFNARSEDAHQKPAFREAYKSKRCLIPASAYYEWTKADDGGKDPHHIYLPENEPFAFAGLWATNDNLDVTSCTILTAAADEKIRHLHNRMPIILCEADYDTWLDPETSVDEARALFENNRGSELTSYPVSRAVNSSKAKGPELIEPISK